MLVWWGLSRQAADGDSHVKNYMVTSYRRRPAAATSSGLQLNITNYNLPITVSYMNYLKQRKVSGRGFFSRALSVR